MTTYDYSTMHESLTEAIGAWWESPELADIDLPYVGNNCHSLMATGALAALLAVGDAQEYLKREGMFQES